MNRTVVATLAAALLLGSTAASSAAPLGPSIVTVTHAGAANAVTNVRWRGHRHHGWHGGYRHDRHYGGGWGPAIGGLAAGAIIGGAIASSNAAAAGGDAVGYCMNRFKSYDPASGTYLGYDGMRHPCP